MSMSNHLRYRKAMADTLHGINRRPIGSQAPCASINRARYATRFSDHARQAHVRFSRFLASILIALVTVAIPGSIEAQPIGEQPVDELCGFDRVMQNLRVSDPGWQVTLDLMERDIQNSRSDPTSQIPPTFNIPVVVHVLHRPGDAYGVGSNISYDQIKWQIQALNAAFARNYPAYNGQSHPTPPAVDSQIGFCLATIPTPNTVPWATNPLGQPECGVMRYAVADAVLEHDMGTEQGLLLSITHPPGRFPFGNYLNVWLVGSICDSVGLPPSPCNGLPSIPGIVGYGTFPNGTFDGIVFRYDAFGDNSPSGNNYPLLTFPDLQQGKILAHEVGHYLSLWHTHHANPTPCAGMTAATCGSDGDLCCDTPPSTLLGYNCIGVRNTCMEVPDLPDQTGNYMSYSDDNCMNTFTACQAARMAATLTGPRSVLASGANLAATGTTRTPSHTCPCNDLVANISYTPPNPCPGANICFTTTSGTLASSWLWNFGDPASGAANTSTMQTPCHVFASPGSYSVTLTVTNPVGQTYTKTTTVVVAIPSAAVIGPTPPPTVCDGSQQCVTIQFTGGTAPWTAILTDGATTYTVNSNQSTMCWPVTVRAGSPNFALTSMADSLGCTGPVSGSTSFTIIPCCPEMIQNGDFEAGLGCYIVPFTTQQVIPSGAPPCSTINPTYYSVYNISAGRYGGWGSGAAFLPNTGNVMMIDGHPTALNTLPAPPHVDLLSQLTLAPATNYMASFWVTQSDPSSTLQLRIKVGSAFVSPTITNPIMGTSPVTWNWVPVNIQFNSGTGGLFSISQVSTFATHGYDFAIDNVSVRSTDPCNSLPCPSPMPPLVYLSTDLRCGPANSGFHHSIDAIGPLANPTGFVSVGERTLPSGQRGLHVVRWNRFGSIVRQRLFSINGTNETIIGTGVDVNANCEVLIAGKISGGAASTHFAAKLDADLDPIWASRLAGDVTNGPSPQADWLVPDGSAAITGMGNDANGNPHRGRVTRLVGGSGNKIWSRSYGPPPPTSNQHFAIHDLEQAPDGTLWVCGAYSDTNGMPAMIMPIDFATGTAAMSHAALYPNSPIGVLDSAAFTAIKIDPTPGTNFGDLLVAGHVIVLGFPISSSFPRAARINRVLGVAPDWDRLYNVDMLTGPSAMGLRCPADSSSAPTDILLAGHDISRNRARTLDIREIDGSAIGSLTHGNSAPPFTTFRDITPGFDRTTVGHIETTNGAGQQILFGQGGCPVYVLPADSNSGSNVILQDISSYDEGVGPMTLVEVPVETACTIVCRRNPFLGDVDCNGFVTVADMEGFVISLLNPEGYASQYPHCNIINADANMDGHIDGHDIDSFILLFMEN